MDKVSMSCLFLRFVPLRILSQKIFIVLMSKKHAYNKVSVAFLENKHAYFADHD